MKGPPVRFRQALAMMRKRDPQTSEDGFAHLLAMASKHVMELIEEFQSEKDGRLRRWLLELIGEARSPEGFSLLAELLDSPQEGIRFWARTGLEKLDTKEARTLLFKRGVRQR